MVDRSILRVRALARQNDNQGGKQAKRDVAVALAFTPERGDAAPRVVASGRGNTARDILDRAFSAGVKIREDADLAQLLAAVDVDSIIPLEAFMAVAEILAYVYQANRQAVPAEASQ